MAVDMTQPSMRFTAPLKVDVHASRTERGAAARILTIKMHRVACRAVALAPEASPEDV